MYVLLFGMLREHGKSSQLRSHGFLFCLFPGSKADCWESIIFSFLLENYPLRPHDAVSSFYKGKSNPGLKVPLALSSYLWERGLIVYEFPFPIIPVNSHTGYVEQQQSQKDQYSPFCKDFECFVNVLVHVLYFVAFLVPGLLGSSSLTCMCMHTVVKTLKSWHTCESTVPFSVAAASAGGEEESGQPRLTEPGAIGKHHLLLNDRSSLLIWHVSLEQVSVID